MNLEGRLIDEQQEMLLLLKSKVESLEREVDICEKEIAFLEKNIMHALSVVSRQLNSAGEKRDRLIKRLSRFNRRITSLRKLFGEETLGRKIPEMARQNSEQMMERVFRRTENDLLQASLDLKEIEQQLENVENVFVKAIREFLISNQHPLRRLLVGTLITLFVLLIFWIYQESDQIWLQLIFFWKKVSSEAALTDMWFIKQQQ